MSKYIDIHRHSANKGEADIVLRNLFHSQISEVVGEDCVSIGLHPWHVNSDTLIDDLKQVRLSLSEKNVLAIGEAGLDKSINTNIDTQEKAFLQQLEMAINNQKPMIIHCVRAYNELLSIRNITKHKQAWIFHWFNSSYEIGRDLLDRGCYLSFGHMLFKETSKAFKAFKSFPLDRVFLETDDAEFSIVEIYKRAAELRNISKEKLQMQIVENFRACFGLEL